MIYSRISKKTIFTIFISLICSSSNGQTWRLAQPEGDAPGFTPGFGQNVYIRGQNSPGIQLTRAASEVTPTIVLSDSTFPGRSIKASPLIALAQDGSALVFWIDGDNQNDKAKWRAHKISSNGEPQGAEILLPHIPTYGWWLDDWNRNSDLASNGQQIVLVWAKFGDIYYQLVDFEANALTAPLQANQDTLKPTPYGGEWEPETFSPSVYMRADGEFIIAWHDLRAADLVFDYDIFVPSGDVGEIYARRFDRTGMPLGDNFAVNSDSIPRVQSEPSICMNDAGTIFCMWLESDTSRYGGMPTVARGRIVGDNFSKAIAGSETLDSGLKPRVAAHVAGFAALWSQDHGLVTQAFDVEGTARSPAQIVFQPYPSTFDIQPLSDASYAAIWSTWPPHYQTTIMARTLDAVSGNLGEPQTIVADGTLITSSGIINQELSLAYLREQKTAVGATVVELNLQARYDIERLNTDRGGASHSEPTSVRLGNGNYLAVWTDLRSGILAVYGQVVDQHGNKVGENFPIYDPDEIYYNGQTPFAASLPDGGAVVAYRSQNEYGSVQGAWLQRISPTGELSGAPVKVNSNSSQWVGEVQIAVVQSEPQRILGAWTDYQNIYAQLLDGEFHALGSSKTLAANYDYFTITADQQRRYWLIGQDWNTNNLFLSGFDANLSRIYGPAQVNDISGSARSIFRPQIVTLDNGALLAAWGSGEYYSDTDGIYAQIFDTNGSRIGKNFLVSEAPFENSFNRIQGFALTTADSLFVVSWHQPYGRGNSEIGLAWFNQFGEMAKPTAIIRNANFVDSYQVFFVGNDRFTFIHDAYGSANPRDIAFDAWQPSAMNTEGWYVSPIFSSNQDTLVWKKLLWVADTPAGTSLRIFFRAADNLYDPLNSYIPWQEIFNGQTEDLPVGRGAQWRVELQGTTDTSPIVWDLIGEYGIKVGVERTSATPPFSFNFLPNYPNPIRGQTTIVYELPSAMEPTITLYNVIGQKIREWRFNRQPAGRHSFTWLGDDQYGRRVTNGIYFLKLTGGSQQMLRKVAIVH